MILSFVSIAVLPLIVVITLIMNQVQAQTINQITNQLESVADLKTSLLYRWLGDATLSMRFIQSQDTNASLVELLSAGQTAGEQERAVDQLLRGAIDSQPSQDRNSLHFERFFVYDAEGRVLAASDPAVIGQVVNRQPYFAKSLAGEITHPPFYTARDNMLTMVITLPVRDAGEQVIGALAGELDLAIIGEIMLERSGLGESGETYLVSSESNYMLTPSRFAGYPQNRAYYSEGINSGLAKRSGSGVYDDYRSPAVPVIGVYRWIPELQAVFLAEIDQQEALAVYRDTASLVFVLALAAALLAAGAGFYVATRFSGPITELTRTAARIAEGELDHRATIDDQSEIGVLAMAFNRMSDRLRQTLSGLEQRVSERTADLAQANLEAQRALTELKTTLSERDQLSASIREISSPVIPVIEGVLVLPLIGAIDSQRATMLTGRLLEAIERHHAEIAIIDVTGVPIIDTQVARALLDTASATRLVGATPILVGVRPELAQTIVGLGLDLSTLITLADLQSGVRYAISLRGKRAPIVR
jgi:anti-anti-sigma regulatory factor/HAMP domain-containing protein